MVYGIGGAGIDVERYSQILERLLDNIVVAIHDILRGHPLLTRFERDGHTMFVRAAEEEHLFSVVTEVAYGSAVVMV